MMDTEIIILKSYIQGLVRDRSTDKVRVHNRKDGII